MYCARRGPLQRDDTAIMLATNRLADSAQSDSSTTWPKFEVVSTEYHEQSSASAISGSSMRAALCVTTLSMMRPVSRNMSAHCATKHSSATVATERPTTTLEIQELNRHSRGTSNTGTAERKAQPKT